MEKKDLFFYENILQGKLKKARDELGAIMEEMQSTRGESAMDYMSLIDHQSRYIESLNRALLRIKNGTFGICNKTGEKIATDRLKLVPNSSMSTFAKNILNKDKKNNKD
ncbi:MAG: hypothetical protein LBD32_02285 [Cytophagales bacterium]|jgi:RNA polymerase-binding transcription factor DksA|nr:hypothetical protein [Cytophagales bacterium]